MYLLYTITTYDYYNITILHTYCHLLIINNRLSVTSDYDCILAMLFGLSMNGRLELTPFSVPTISRLVNVNRKGIKQKMSGQTVPGSLNACPMCKRQRWIFNVPMILLWYTGPPSLGLARKDPAILELKAYLCCSWQCSVYFKNWCLQYSYCVSLNIVHHKL